MIKINFQTASRIPKSKQKRRKCLPIVYNLLCIINRAQQDGFLAIESLLSTPPFPIDSPDVGKFFKTILQCAVDGVKEENIIRFSTTVLSTRKWKGNELLSLILAVEGALSFRRQEHPDILYNLLLCWIGIDLQDEVEKLLADALKLLKMQKQLEEVDMMEAFFSNQNRKARPGKLDKLLGTLDKPLLKALINECRSEKFAHALLTCQKETVVYVFEQIGSSFASYIENAIRKAYPFTSASRQKKEVKSVLSAYPKAEKKLNEPDESEYILTEMDLKDLDNINLDDLEDNDDNN